MSTDFLTFFLSSEKMQKVVDIKCREWYNISIGTLLKRTEFF